jgi:demethylmenaquinone methyltransferase/2-methoxy-6-polyprenyl-1,4-benzoquinol methylase
LIARLQMRWPEVDTELTWEDRAAHQRLCRPASLDFIVGHPDYCAFFTYSMFHGKVAE